ncbi:galactosylceramide sulfotransferase isoform X1 [Hydra vulgaris]|uniref:galactosylceramide sulfotransferase isoform X1 n=2 Tax=Hydra vulgaris TaxID=6087 RepID=UPI001F5FF25B|nr:galactosylceramide sulfotransferase-like isoform X1 [Hydra vulgaris]
MLSLTEYFHKNKAYADYEPEISNNSMYSIRFFIILLIVWSLSFFLAFTALSKITSFRNALLENILPAKANGFPVDLVDDFYSALRDMQINKNVLSNISKSLLEISDETLNITRERQCSPDKNIVFLKTHKTASSTVTNILNRYADLHELTVALPSMDNTRFDWPRKFHWSSVDLQRLDGTPANILSNHARYNRDQMKLIMEDNSKYISIIRDPVSQFESSFYYFEFDKILGLSKIPNPIEEFLKYPDEYLYNFTILMGDLPDTLNLLQSGMFYDFGYDFMDLEDTKGIQRVLKTLENEFQLILITEYFDESLVLLKKELCWQTDDILYIKQNQRLKKGNLTAHTKQRIQQWNRADVMLYQHFNETFWRKIKDYGDSFWEDVNEFKKENKKFEKICSPEKITTKGFGINVDVNSFVMNPKVDRFHRYLCEKVLMNEVEYLSYFKKKFGKNFGYQNLLVAQGMKPIDRERTLHSRLKIKNGPKFFKLPISSQKQGSKLNFTATSELKAQMKLIE